MPRQFVHALDNEEIIGIKNQRVADTALAKFRERHKDFDATFPLGVAFKFDDGDGEVIESEVRDAIAKRYTREKRRKEFDDHVRAQNRVLKELMDAGWRPPAPQGEVTARRRITRQPDGSAVVEDLD